MARRSIEATFKSIAPSRIQGIPYPPVAGGSFAAGGGDAGSSLTNAASEISQLRMAYQQQTQLIAANTQAIQSNTSAQSSHSAASTIGSAASNILGGGLGLISPIISGIMHLFGGGQSQPAPLSYYAAPQAVSLSGFLQPQAAGSPAQSAQTAPAAASTQVTVHVNAMDSQSFMDRSSDIASAVREAMLNLHPINDVISKL